jgi:hypothetical protein
MLFRETIAVYCESHTEHTNSVRTSQETHYVSATKPNPLMLFRETIAVYCESHMEHTNTLCGQNAIYINPVRTSQGTHYVSATKPNRLMLFRETSLFIVRTIWNIQIDCVGRMQSFRALKQVVRIVTTGL